MSVRLASSNCIAGPKSIFSFVEFDEQMPFVFEDLDFTYRVRKSGFHILYCQHWRVYHHQRKKSPLQEVYLSDRASAYQKGKNRTQFVKKVASFWQRVQYRGFGLRANSFFMILRILIYAPGVQKRYLTKSFLKGTRDGIRSEVAADDGIYS